MALEVKDRVLGILRQEALVQETSPALELGRIPQTSSYPNAPDETQGSGVVGKGSTHVFM